MRTWRSLQEWQQDASAQHAVEDAVAVPVPVLRGRCGLCESLRGFATAGASSDPREGLQCLACGCNARQRAVAMVLLSMLAGSPAGHGGRVYLSEQASPLFVALHRQLPRLEGSEFVTGWVRRMRMAAWLFRRGVRAWIRHRDVTALDFDGASLDAVASLDVLEHVPRHELALAEFARVLRPGGALVFTVPFYENQLHTETIARVREDGTVEFSGEAEYHGDPRGGGVPCFHHFGWDLVATLQHAGFADARLMRVQEPAQGVPRGIWVVHAVR
jgi:SAM-dependent methyltransferase